MKYENPYWIDKIKKHSEESNDFHFQLSEFAKDLGLSIFSNYDPSDFDLSSLLEDLFHQHGNIGPITLRRFIEIIEKLLEERAKAHATATYVIDDMSEADDLDMICMGRTYISAFQILIARDISEVSRKSIERMVSIGDDNLWKAYPDFLKLWREREGSEFVGDGLDRFWWSHPELVDFTMSRPRFDEYGRLVPGTDTALKEE